MIIKTPRLNIDAYLHRIKCSPERIPSLKYLKKLHQQHLLTVPFENLDIHMGNEIILDVARIFQKVVNHRRGGFCHELNGLFFHLLKQIGFDAHLISASMFNDDGSLGKPFEHMAMLVYLDNKTYLCDVGSGKSFLHPKELSVGQLQMDFNRYFRIDRTREDNFLLMISEDGASFDKRYQFSDEPRQFVEFNGMCHYEQTSPDSIFRKQKLITQARKDGRITLTDKKFSITKLGKTEEYEILNQDQFRVKLEQHFGIRYHKVH